MISVEHLTKCYGEHMAVQDLSFDIDEGRVYGFLGPNGAGKSTTMNIMTGCLAATEGRVLVDGHDIFEQPQQAKRLIGYLPEQPPLYMNESPEEYLRFVGEAKGLRVEALRAQIEEVIEQTGLAPVRHRRIAALSKGYKQRVGIAQALLGAPKVIILDEPTVGLDPIQIIEIRELIRRLGKSHTVIFSSHILSEVQTICDEILMMANGRLVAFDKPENLEKRLARPSELTLLLDGDRLTAQRLLEGMEELQSFSLEETADGLLSARLQTEGEPRELTGRLSLAFAQAGLAILEIHSRKANLEDVFLELSEAGDAEAAEAEASMEAEAETEADKNAESEGDEA